MNMSETLWAAISILALLSVISAIRSYKKREHLKFASQLLFSAGLFFLLFWLRSHTISDEAYHLQLTGLPFSAKSSYSYESARSFQGDGYSLFIYELNPNTAQLFLNPGTDFFASYPENPEFRKNWQQVKWRKTPSQNAESKFIEFALSGGYLADENESRKYDERRSEIKEILNETGNFYAYNYHLHAAGHVGDLDFFIIAPKRRRFIMINHNT